MLNENKEKKYISQLDSGEEDYRNILLELPAQ